MADGSGGGGGAALGVLVGGLVVVVAVIGFVMLNGSGGGLSPSKNINVNIHPPTISSPVPSPVNPSH